MTMYRYPQIFETLSCGFVILKKSAQLAVVQISCFLTCFALAESRTSKKANPALSTTNRKHSEQTLSPAKSKTRSSVNIETRSPTEDDVDTALVARMDRVRNSLMTDENSLKATQKRELWARIKTAYEDQKEDVDYNGKLKAEKKKAEWVLKTNPSKEKKNQAKIIIQKPYRKVRNLSTEDYQTVMKMLASLPESERDFFALTMTAFGEARGQCNTSQILDKQGRAEMMAVMQVISNRAIDARTQKDPTIKQLKTSDIFSVATQPRHFSCWNRTDLNLLPMLLGEKVHTGGRASYRRALQAYQDWKDPDVKVNVKFSGGLEKSKTTHYFARTIAAPDWAIGREALQKPTVLVPPPPPPPETIVVSKAHFFYNAIAWSYWNHWIKKAEDK